MCKGKKKQYTDDILYIWYVILLFKSEEVALKKEKSCKKNPQICDNPGKNVF